MPQIISNFSLYKYRFLSLVLGLLLASTPAVMLQGATLQTEVIATRLKVPWQIDFAPDKRIFITERAGTIQVLETNTQGIWVKRTWAKLTNVFTGGEAGLLGLALDPNFTQTGYVYVAYNYTQNKTPYNRLARYREVGSGKNRRGQLDTILLENIPAAWHHNGGRLKFHPDQTLFWGIGDRLVPTSAQNLKALTGKILRLNRDGSIPSDNPFPNSYIYSYGHRNVQGIAFTSTEQPRIFASEHGPSSWPLCCRDEVNEIHPGSNYGWPLITGAQSEKQLITPMIHSGNKVTWAPGGLVYIDTGNWNHSLLVTGLRGNALYHIKLAPTTTTQNFSTVQKVTAYFKRKWGRLRDIARAPTRYGFSGHYYMLTSNRDGRGQPTPDDDKIIRLILP